MVLGYAVRMIDVIYLGLFVGVLYVFQMLVGMRVIHFKGRLHMKVHKWGAWVIAVLSAVHGLLALVLYNGWSVLS
jgi:hypothetical protein